MSTGGYALELDHLTKDFGGISAVKDISLQVQKGQIYGIIGPNGAGKTTIFNLITGVYKPTSGDIRMFGKSIQGKPTYEIARLGMARTFQNIRLFGNLSVYQNVYTSCQINMNYSFWSGIFQSKKYREQEKLAQEFCDQVLKDVGLENMKDSVAHSLPYGIQRRLEIVRALATRPKILLLDEPAAGMNEEESAELSTVIKMIRNTYDLTIIVIDHHMDVIMDVCEQISVINFGEMLFTGTANEVQENQAVTEAYLGVED